VTAALAGASEPVRGVAFSLRPWRRAPQAAPTGPDDPPRVQRIDPPPDSCGVFRDAPVVLSLTHPVDPGTADARTVAVADAEGVIPASVEVILDGRFVVWRAQRLLAPGELHLVYLEGLRDHRGRAFPPFSSCFFPCDLASTDL